MQHLQQPKLNQNWITSNQKRQWKSVSLLVQQTMFFRHGAASALFMDHGDVPSNSSCQHPRTRPCKGWGSRKWVKFLDLNGKVIKFEACPTKSWRQRKFTVALVHANTLSHGAVARTKTSQGQRLLNKQQFPVREFALSRWRWFTMESLLSKIHFGQNRPKIRIN